jgi:arylsulfatase A-like enzyme
VRETQLLFGHGPHPPPQAEAARFTGLATHLEAAGYATAWVGKWHSVGSPAAMGFAHRFGSLFGQLHDFYAPSLRRYPPRDGPGSNGTVEVKKKKKKSGLSSAVARQVCGFECG